MRGTGLDVKVRSSAELMPEAAKTVQEILRRDQRLSVFGTRAQAIREENLFRRAPSDCVELPGDVVRNPPEITDIGLPDERIGAPLMPPIEQIDILPAGKGGRNVRFLRGPDDQAQRPDCLIVGCVYQLRRRAAVGHDEPRAAKIEPPWFEVG